MSHKLFIVAAAGIVLFFSCGESKEVVQHPSTKTEISDDTIGQPENYVSIGNAQPIDQVVRNIFQDSQLNLWFGTESGLFVYNGEELVFISELTDEIGRGVTVKDIVEDKLGRIWVGHSGGLSCIENGRVINYYQSNGLISNDVWTIEADSSGRIWAGTIEGVCSFDGKNFVPFKLPEGEIDTTLGISSTKMVHQIFEDSKGTLWFSTNAGLFSYRDSTLLNVSKMKGIATNFINQIIEGNNDEYWVSTKEDLYLLNKDTLQNITHNKINTGKGIGSVAVDQHGKVWFVVDQHQLYFFEDNELSQFHKSAENKGPVVFQIFNDQQEKLWFVGFGGAFRLENGNFISITDQGPW